MNQLDEKKHLNNSENPKKKQKKEEDKHSGSSSDSDAESVQSIHLKAPEDQGNIGKFGVSKEKLIAIAYACQDRNFSEEVDLFESLGGSEKLE